MSRRCNHYIIHYLNSGFQCQPGLLAHSITGIVQTLSCENQQLGDVFRQICSATVAQRVQQSHSSCPSIRSLILGCLTQLLNQYCGSWSLLHTQHNSLSCCPRVLVRSAPEGTDQCMDNTSQVLVQSLTCITQNRENNWEMFTQYGCMGH